MKGDYRAAEALLEKLQTLKTQNFPGDKVTQANISDLRGMILTRTGHPEEGGTYADEATALYQTFLTRGANGITLARMH